MENKILVAYASKYGATKEIAERVGVVLQNSGKHVDVVPASRISDITPYEAVILGSAIYVGKWPKEAEVFLQANEKHLAERPFWLFSSGPTGEGDPVALVDGKCVPGAMQKVIDRINPREIKLFHGNIDPEKINPIEKWAVKSVVKKPFGDFRDWNDIVKWSNKVAVAVNGE